MDKQRSKSTITIKINGNDRKYQEELQAASCRIQDDRIADRPNQTKEVDCLSELAATQEAVDESFDWILPEDDEIEEYIITKQPKEKKKSSSPTLKNHFKNQNNKPLKSLFFSFLLAIIIGISLGSLVLKLFITDTQVKDAPVTTTPEEKAVDKKNPIETSKSLEIPALNTFIIQGGVFSSVDSAKTEEQNVKLKGVPTQIIEDNGKAILILGTADSIEKAKEIGNSLKIKGIEVFAKPYSLPGKNLTESSVIEGDLLKQSVTVYQVLASLSSNGLISKSMDENILIKQKDFIQSIKKESIKSEKLEQLRMELAGAIAKLESYNHQPKESYLLEAQQYLLSFLNTYYTL